MAKIDYSQLPTIRVTFDDGKIASYQVTAYHGAQIGCFAYQMNSVHASGYIYKGNTPTNEPIPPWEPTTELIEAVAAHLVKGAAATTFVIMGDAINRGTEVRKPAPLYDPYAPGSVRASAALLFDTKTFVEYLIKHKVGTIYASPIGRNRNHSSPSNFSLCQVWIWVPPESIGWVIPNSEAVFNHKSVPKAEWAKNVSDYWLRSYRDYLKKDETYDWDYLVKNGMHAESPLFARALDY